MSKTLLLACTLLYFAPAAVAGREATYEGTWNTTNRKLDGEMKCIVKKLPDSRWQGRFFGVWQGVDFDYTVPFTGPPSRLQGKATIDGASYEWRGVLTPSGGFDGTFGGSRYEGYFRLKRAE